LGGYFERDPIFSKYFKCSNFSNCSDGYQFRPLSHLQDFTRTFIAAMIELKEWCEKSPEAFGPDPFLYFY